MKSIEAKKYTSTHNFDLAWSIYKKYYISLNSFIHSKLILVKIYKKFLTIKVMIEFWNFKKTCTDIRHEFGTCEPEKFCVFITRVRPSAIPKVRSIKLSIALKNFLFSLKYII